MTTAYHYHRTMPGFGPPLCLDDCRALAEAMASNKEVTIEQSMWVCKVKFPALRVGGSQIAKGGHVGTLWYNTGKKENMTVISSTPNEDILLEECETLVKFYGQCPEQGAYLEPPEGKAWSHLTRIWRIPAYFAWSSADAPNAANTDTQAMLKMKAPPMSGAPMTGVGPPTPKAIYKAPPQANQVKLKGPPPQAPEHQYPMGLAEAGAAGPIPQMPVAPGELLLSVCLSVCLSACLSLSLLSVGGGGAGLTGADMTSAIITNV